MAKQTINTLRQWFRTGIKPTQQQFWDWLDSFWHKDDKIPITSLDGLQLELDKKADKDSVQNGVTPTVGDNGNWFIGDRDTGVKASATNGNDGLTPTIGENGNWFIGDTDTGVKAAATNGNNGITPTIGENGNWFIGATDTGIKAEGQPGQNARPPEKGVDYFDGITPHIGVNGNWYFNTTDTGIRAVAISDVEAFGFAMSDPTTDITAGVKVPCAAMPYSCTATGVRIQVAKPAIGVLKLTIDAKINGVSIFTTKVTLDSNETVSETASVPYVLTNALITMLTSDTIEIGRAHV